MQAEPGINVQKALKLLQADGPLSLSLKGYEPRAAQLEMMRNVIDAYNQQAIALIEAGTGTGKSIAYLLPALLWAVQRKERTVISTNTITLQEQLILKDIPLLTKALNLEVKAVLVKGMSNYICLRKLDDAKQELRLLPPDEAVELEKIAAWAHSTHDGSRSDIPFIPSGTTWEKVGAENDTCNKQDCPYYQLCPFFKARRQANDAHIMVVNHHLLFADLACRADNDNYKNPAVLPFYNHIVLDEAHNIEDVATEYFATHISRINIMRSMARLASEKQAKSQGKLPLLKEKLLEQYRKQTPPKGISSLYSRLNIELPNMRHELLQLLAVTFQSFADFVQTLQRKDNHSDDSPQGDKKLRLLPCHQTHPDWSNFIVPQTKQFIGAMQRYVQVLNSLEVDFKALDNDRLNEQTKGLRFEITALASRLAESCTVLANFLTENQSTTTVRWIEAQTMRTMTNIHLVEAELNISHRLVKYLFSKFPTVILCSATLTTNKKFEFTRNRLGLTSALLPGRRIIEAVYESPFNFQQQALFAVPTDMPNPQDPQFTPVAAEKIWQAIQASHGNAFVLFTSYTMLKTCYQLLAQRLEDHRYITFKQGDDNRQSLLDKFKATDRSILFGTDSFWEGVDVVGDALRCVIIVKLPFKVPSEPIIQARTEAITAQGGDPFFEYSLPNAIVKFKQGIGRLIRNKRDRGCIICLDSRLISKNYGKQFLNSMPPSQQLFVDSNLMQQKMVEFYRKTYHLTLQK